jgi:hypothetical protein
MLTEDDLKAIVSECAETMTLHLLNGTNMDIAEGDRNCCCITCLASLCVEIVINRISDEIDEELMDGEVDEIYEAIAINHNRKIDKKDIN